MSSSAERMRKMRKLNAEDPERKNRTLETMFMFGCVEIAIIIDLHQKIWFRGVDLARALEMTDTANQNICATINKKYTKSYEQLTSQISLYRHIAGIHPHTTFVNEAGMNLFVLRSRMPKAEAFVDWVCEEVLPSIRRTGRYEVCEENNPYKTLNDYLKQRNGELQEEIAEYKNIVKAKDNVIQSKDALIETKDNMMTVMTAKMFTLQECAVLPNAREVKDEYVVIYRKFDLTKRAEVANANTLMFPYYGCRVQMDNLLVRKTELMIDFPQLEELLRLKVPNSVNFFNYMFDEMTAVIERGCNKGLITAFRIRNDDVCAAEDAVMTQIINLYRCKYGNKNIMYKGVEFL
nr:hypothetical protein [Microctonus hyperodae filamentous virus]